jgi:hypothetical protein
VPDNFHNPFCLHNLFRLFVPEFCNRNFMFLEERPARRGVFHSQKRKEDTMKKLALGLVAAATLLTAAPAMAQVGFYAGPGGVGVGFGGPYYSPYGYYDYYGGPGFYGGPAWRYHHWHHWH